MINFRDAIVNVLQPRNSEGRTSSVAIAGLCCIGLIFFLLAGLIVLSLIPVYLPARDIDGIRRSSPTNLIATTSTTTITTTTTTTITTTTTTTITTTTTTTITTTTTTIIASDEDRFYVFDFLNANSGISMGGGGRTVAATAANFPALIGNGVAMTVGYISGCGINLPHTHPRATEINIIISGQFETGLFQENTAKFIMETVNAGQVTVFLQGAIHFEQNLNCEPAIFVAGFNSADPGVQTVASSLFGGLPADIVGASLGELNITSADDLRRLLPNNPALGIELCRQRCGLK